MDFCTGLLVSDMGVHGFYKRKVLILLIYLLIYAICLYFCSDLIPHFMNFSNIISNFPWLFI